MPNIVVRPIGDKDIPGTAAALIEVHATDGYPVEGVKEPEAWIRPADTLSAWVAENNGKIVGHVAITAPQGEEGSLKYSEECGQREKRTAFLVRLFVIREARRQAVGERLTRAAMDYAQEKSLRLNLEVLTKDAAAIRLYERLGWQRVGNTRHSFGPGKQASALRYVWPK